MIGLKYLPVVFSGASYPQLIHELRRHKISFSKCSPRRTSCPHFRKDILCRTCSAWRIFQILHMMLVVVMYLIQGGLNEIHLKPLQKKEKTTWKARLDLQEAGRNHKKQGRFWWRRVAYEAVLSHPPCLIGFPEEARKELRKAVLTLLTGGKDKGRVAERPKGVEA